MEQGQQLIASPLVYGERRFHTKQKPNEETAKGVPLTAHAPTTPLSIHILLPNEKIYLPM